MRRHCSNGVIFEQEVATLKAAHQAEALEKLNIEMKSKNMDALWEQFAGFVKEIRSIEMDEKISHEVMNAILRPPPVRAKDSKRCQQEASAVRDDLVQRLSAYRQELGSNAYALFNTLTDVAARPPASPRFRRDRIALEKDAGRWLRRIVAERHEKDFCWTKHVDGWRDGKGIQQVSLPGRN